MSRLAIFAAFLVVIGEVRCHPQRTTSSRPISQPSPQPTTTTGSPNVHIPHQQPPIQVLNIIPGQALQLAGGIVGEIIAAIKPTPQPPAQIPFSCVGRFPGYYADISTNCKNFYTCSPRGRQEYHRCGERTIFNQYYLTCDHRRNYNCQRALQDYSVNEQIRPFTRTRHHSD